MERILLTIKGSQRDNGRDEHIEFMTEGRFIKTADGYLLEYDESELTGEEGSITRLILKDDSVTLLRTGKSEVHMIFTPHSVYESSIETPEGVLRMSLLPLRVESELYEKSGHLSLKYELSIGSLSTINKLDLSFKSVEGCIN
ncbi:MAG: DUF1934 domain-containing protein [Christensenellales bacterium]|jgi:uncharacterized beta-barrel protein YwiB (DUF1934 family)